MRRHLVLATRVTGVLCSIVMLVSSYTPNHYYPVLRRLHPDKSLVSHTRRQHTDPGNRITQVSSSVPESPLISITGSTDILGLRPRRLMGIFRCYGWGPGCSDVAIPSSSLGHALSKQSTSGRTVKNSQFSSAANDQPSNYAGLPVSLDPVKSRIGHENGDNQDQHTPEAEPYVRSSSISGSDSVEQTPSSSGAFRFQPFFTLTSGASWGPTGKKRHLAGRYSAADKRIDFLKQILQDMFEEDDIDNDQDGDRLLAVGASTKRRAIDVLNFNKNSHVAMVTDFNEDLTDTEPKI